jgi:HlyD family secretion protein
MKSVIGVVILAAVVGGIYLVNDLTRGDDGKSILHVARELEIEVEATTPAQSDIVRVVQAPGEVEAFAEVDISSEIVSKITAMPVEEGDRVEKGELLCRLDDADYQARVVSAEANVAKLKAQIVQAQADKEKADRDYQHQLGLTEVNATSTLELANYRTATIATEAILETRRQELIEAEAALDSAREYLAKTVITAPIGGVVSQLFAEEGEVVVTGTMNNLGTRIMVVSDLSKMQVRCRVDEMDAALVGTGQPARIYLQSDTRRSVPGEVYRVGAKGTKQLGRDVVTFETLVLVTGDDPRVKPGMTANVEIEVARREGALTIPVQAVVYRKRKDLPEELVEQYDRQLAERDPGARQHQAEYVKTVFCIADNKAYPHLVQTGISDARRVEVEDGIKLADTVVVGPYRSLDRLKQGSPIKIEEKPKAQPDEKQPGAAGEGEAVLASAEATGNAQSAGGSEAEDTAAAEDDAPAEDRARPKDETAEQDQAQDSADRT